MSDPADTAALRADQRRRWEQGDRVPAEDYLARHPALAADAEAAVDMIYGEFLLRERLGEKPDPEEFFRRFPDHAAVLRDQLDLNRALRLDSTPPPEAAPTADQVVVPVDPNDLPAPLGRYRLLRLLGRGGMGAVYLTYDEQLDRHVALKVPNLHPAADPRGAERFLREARAAAALDHPNLCPVFDAGRVGDRLYLTMPYLRGETLSQRLRRAGPLPPAEAAWLCRTVARAVQAAHDAGIIHRDLKPSNVLLTDRGAPVVTDFGLARRATADAQLTDTGAFLGTPAYAAPEQLEGDAEALTPRCDVYSLGAILYECLTGGPPFSGTPGAVLRQALTDEIEPPSRRRPGLDPRVDEVCLAALAKDPARRTPSMDAFATALAPLAAARADDTADGLPPTTVALRARRAAPGRRRWLAAAGVAAAVVAGLAVWLGTRPQPGPLDSGRETIAPTASAPAGDVLPQGSEWAGEFRFVGSKDPPGVVELTVIGRSGDTFRGVYRTEGAYRWEVEGTVRDTEIRWGLTKALNQAAERTRATNRAYVEGRVTGRDMAVTFIDPGDGSRAPMKLRRQE
jgi:hypothetical protein